MQVCMYVIPSVLHHHQDYLEFNCIAVRRLTNEYRLTQKSVNLSVKCTVEYNSNIIITKITGIFRNEILRVKCVTHNIMVSSYKLTGRF